MTAMATATTEMLQARAQEIARITIKWHTFSESGGDHHYHLFWASLPVWPQMSLKINTQGHKMVRLTFRLK